MGGMGGSQTTNQTQNSNTSSTSTYSPNAAAMDAYKNLLPAAQSAANSASTFNDTQNQAFKQLGDMQGGYQPGLDAANAYTAAGAGPISGKAISNYMNPYQQDVIDSTMANLQHGYDLQSQNLKGNAIAQGALGGSRAKIAQAELARGQGQTTAQTLAGLNQSNYNQALSAAQGDASRSLAAGAQTGNLAQMQQQLGLQGTQALLSAGNQQQQLPLQTLQWLANLQTGVGSQMGGTTSGTSTGTTTGTSKTTEQPGMGQMIGAGLGALAMFSDERMKEDIEPVGKSFDGQTIYKFRYKGDPKAQIGLLAQDVERHHPEAVGSVGGLKTVNYDTATREAAHRGHFADGGDASFGSFGGGSAFPTGAIAAHAPAMPQISLGQAPQLNMSGGQGQKQSDPLGDAKKWTELGQGAKSGLSNLNTSLGNAVFGTSSGGGAGGWGAGTEPSGGFLGGLASSFGFAAGGEVHPVHAKELMDLGSKARKHISDLIFSEAADKERKRFDDGGAVYEGPGSLADFGGISALGAPMDWEKAWSDIAPPKPTPAPEPEPAPSTPDDDGDYTFAYRQAHAAASPAPQVANEPSFASKLWHNLTADTPRSPFESWSKPAQPPAPAAAPAAPQQPSVTEEAATPLPEPKNAPAPVAPAAGWESKAEPVQRYPDYINNAAKSVGLRPQTLATFARIESGGNPQNRTGSYKGLFQLSDAEFQKYGGGNIWNPTDNAMAAARKLDAERGQFAEKYGREPTDAELYMIHQQGWGGYANHAANPDAPAWQNMANTAEGRQKGEAWAKQAIWGNVPADVKAQFPGGVGSLTSRQFMDLWANKVNHFGGMSLPASRSTGTGPGATSSAYSGVMRAPTTEYAAPPASEAGQQKGGLIKRLFGVDFNPLQLSDNERMGLLAAGLGMMGNTLNPLGGAAQGLQTYMGQENKDREFQMESKKLALQAQQEAQRLALHAQQVAQGNIKPTVLGYDSLGREIHGFMDVTTGKPITGPGYSATSDHPIDPSIRGEAYLKTQPLEVQDRARAVLAGQEPMPKSTKADPMATAVRQAVLRADESYKDNRFDYAKAWDDPNKKVGFTRQANNAAIGHGGELSDLIDNAPDHFFGVQNRVHNWWKSATNDPWLKAWQSNAEIFAGEVAKVNKGGVPSQSENERILETLNPSNGKAALDAALGKYVRTLNSKTDALRNDRIRNMGPYDRTPSVIDEQLIPVLDRLKKKYGIAMGEKKSERPPPPTAAAATEAKEGRPKEDGAPQSSAPAPAEIPKVSTKAEYDALPSGAEFIAPDGTHRRKP
jgi:hypothetical protein